MEIVQFDKTKEMTIEPCIFILFCEYMGYVSPFIDWAEKACTTDKLEDYKSNILYTEASVYLNELKKEYEITKLREYFNLFDELFIYQWKQLYNSHHNKSLLAL